MGVFPTRVGVDLGLSQSGVTGGSFPHTRGGGPQNLSFLRGQSEFSPHAWGWTVLLLQVDFRQLVFPTRVGVDRRVRL